MDGIKTRDDFLYKVKYAKVADTGPYPDDPSLLALVYSQIGGLIGRAKQCDQCRSTFLPYLRKDGGDRLTWCWRQQSQDCWYCGGTKPPMAKDTILAGVQTKFWLRFYDIFTMWLFDYPRLIILREAKVHHSVYDEVESKLQNTVVKHMRDQSDVLGLQNCCQKVEVNKIRQKSLASMRGKKGRSAKEKADQWKHALCPKRTNTFYKKFKYVVQLDEAHLNKKKAGKLSKMSRPQRDQVWVWGAVVQDKPDQFYYRIMDHPEDAFDGKPRGWREILTCLHMLNLKRGTILVTDGWKGTKAAIKHFILEKGWSANDLHHEVVNHSKGEIVNQNGFTTNGIENRWSVVKRWLRKRCGGRMPTHTDRVRWSHLLTEFQWRKLAANGNTTDWANTFFVPMAEGMNMLSSA